MKTLLTISFLFVSLLSYSQDSLYVDSIREVIWRSSVKDSVTFIEYVTKYELKDALITQKVEIECMLDNHQLYVDKVETRIKVFGVFVIAVSILTTLML